MTLLELDGVCVEPSTCASKLEVLINVVYHEWMALQDAVNVRKDSSALQFYLLTVSMYYASILSQV